MSTLATNDGIAASKGQKNDLNLLGKDYFTEEEAAHYACVSPSQFRVRALEYGLQAGWWMGKKVYRKADLQRAIEAVWQPYVRETGTGNSTGPIGRAVIADR